MGWLRTGNTGDGFLARQICYVDEGIVKGGENVGYTENQFAFCDLGAERNCVVFLGLLDFFGRLYIQLSAMPSNVNSGISKQNARYKPQSPLELHSGRNHVPLWWNGRAELEEDDERWITTKFGRKALYKTKTNISAKLTLTCLPIGIHAGWTISLGHTLLRSISACLLLVFLSSSRIFIGLSVVRSISELN